MPGVDTAKFSENEKKTVQMHIQESEHSGVGWCAKIVFFSLMAILAGLVFLIVLQNRGVSDCEWKYDYRKDRNCISFIYILVDTPLSESRFQEYLQGWVDETREEEPHEESPHLASHEDHDEPKDEVEYNEQLMLPADEPYPEEKDDSLPDSDNGSERDLNSEINDSEQQEENNSEEEEQYGLKENLEIDNDDNQEKSNEDESSNTAEEVISVFEDSTPFEEEVYICQAQ